LCLEVFINFGLFYILTMASSPVRSSSVPLTSSPPRTSDGFTNYSSELRLSSEVRAVSRSGGVGKRGGLSAVKKNKIVILPSVPGTDATNQEVVWGTVINMSEVNMQIKNFLQDFYLNEEQYYMQLLHEALVSQSSFINLNVQHLLEYSKELYYNLKTYPQEVVVTFDQVINEIANEHFQEEVKAIQENDREMSIQICPFNYKDKQALRQLDPKLLDQMVATSGMVIRVNPVIPEMERAFFRCDICQRETVVQVDSGRIDEPTVCENNECRSRNSYQIIYCRCEFSDRQLVKIQESPETIPEGETPRTIDAYLYGDMVDYCKPGDRVEITGVYRCESVRKNPRRAAVESVYHTFVDVVHVLKKRKMQFLKKENEMQDLEEYSTWTQVEETSAEQELKRRKLEELGQDPDIYERLVKSFAPSIWEMEDIKKGILCQLFGATEKIFTEENVDKNTKFRNEMNVLLCGDPGTSKSQLLQYVHKVAPRGIYTSGKGSSAVGLTAYITKDPETNDLVLESGALVLSDRGICCIDEFDKMSQAARSILHEVMEQQTVSIAKAGIIAQLNARTSILAAANPVESRYNPKKPVTENIDLPPTLLSRFDLIYLVLDIPQEKKDRRLAHHLVSLYYKEEDRPERSVDFIDAKTFQEYITFSRENYHPKLTDEACEELIKAYVDVRNMGRHRGRKIITATPRNLESLIRLSESLARMRHSHDVERKDVMEAVRLQAAATQKAAIDPRTGQFDMGILNAGVSDTQRRKLEVISKLITMVINDVEGMNIRTNQLFKQVGEAKKPEDFEEDITYRDLNDALHQLEEEGFVRVANRHADNPMVKIIR